MERDFLGLGSKNVPITVKEEEEEEEAMVSAPVRGSGMQWSFSNKVSAIPQFLSFKPAQEDRPRKTVHDPLASSGFMPISTADAFDSNQKPYGQRNMILDKQGGNHYAMTTYGLQHLDAYPVHRPQEVRIFPVSNQSNQTITVSMSTPLLHSHLGSTGQTVVGKTVNPQLLGGVPIVTPVSIPPTTSSIVGTTDPRNASKSSAAPAQLTIFYAGSVCVYDDVSPEKAQAIMLLAGNGSSMTHNKMLPMAQVQAPIPRPSAADAYVGNKSHTAPIPSPISVASHVGSQSGGAPSSTNELATVKPIGALSSCSNQLEPPKVASSVGSAATTLIPAAVPQARKASLARFLEKRKERVMNMAPYNVSKKSPDCSTLGAEGLSFSFNSGSSSSLPAISQGTL